jgi:hypothetical protein
MEFDFHIKVSQLSVSGSDISPSLSPFYFTLQNEKYKNDSWNQVSTPQKERRAKHYIN